MFGWTKRLWVLLSVEIKVIEILIKIIEGLMNNRLIKGHLWARVEEGQKARPTSVKYAICGGFIYSNYQVRVGPWWHANSVSGWATNIIWLATRTCTPLVLDNWVGLGYGLDWACFWMFIIFLGKILFETRVGRVEYVSMISCDTRDSICSLGIGIL